MYAETEVLYVLSVFDILLHETKEIFYGTCIIQVVKWKTLCLLAITRFLVLKPWSLCFRRQILPFGVETTCLNFYLETNVRSSDLRPRNLILVFLRPKTSWSRDQKTVYGRMMEKLQLHNYMLCIYLLVTVTGYCIWRLYSVVELSIALLSLIPTWTSFVLILLPLFITVTVEHLYCSAVATSGAILIMFD